MSAPARANLICVLCTLASLVAGCRTTVDSLGYNQLKDAGKRELQHLTGPTEYENAFRDVLGKTDEEIEKKIDNAFDTLFHGNPDTQSFFFATGNKAVIKDIFHNQEVRTEGMGLGMMICVEYNKQFEFDQLWRYAKDNLMVKSGPARGYFNSYCDTGAEADTESRSCLDPFGLQQMAMALVLAHGRWGSSDEDTDPGAIDYNTDAWMLLDVMRDKEKENGGVIERITNTFDSSKVLAFDEPVVTAFNYTRPAVEMPAFYELWAQATGDGFWNVAAINARGFWRSVAHEDTGLLPVKAYFSGNEFSGWNVFAPEGYRTQLNMTLDQIWIDKSQDSSHEKEANLIVDFFAGILASGKENYGMIYELDGTPIDETAPDASLVSANGDTALISTSANRQAFIQAVWDLSLPTGDTRYYAGLLYLTSLLVLSGQYRVY